MIYNKPYAYFFVAVLFISLSVFLREGNTKTTDILIVAPHPDDAVLCCAGIIQQSISHGKTVRVVNITDGDGYQEAAAALARKPTSAATAADMLRLGRARRKEEITALTRLGIPRKHMVFLGYPDGLLEEVYGSSANKSVINPFTLKTHTPANKPFTKSSFMSELTGILTKQKPRVIYVTSMHDTALDHQITYRFVMDTINEAGYTGKLFTYIIHKRQETPISYPSTSVITLSEGELLMKKKTIRKYTTQMIQDEDFLMSFAQNTEQFY